MVLQQTPAQFLTSHPRRGQALVEFGIISFVLAAMLAGLLGIIVLALGSFQNNIAAESAGRLLNERLDSTLADAQAVYVEMADPTDTLYDESLLILTSAQFFDSSFKDTLPPINRMLLGNFIYDTDRDVYRYPGAVVTNSNGALTVLIPLLPDAALGATNGIDRSHSASVASSYPVAANWVGPVTVSRVDPVGTASRTCTVAFFHPSQPGSMVNLELTRDADGRVIFHDPVIADDGSVSLGSLPTGYSFAAPVLEKDIASASRGQYGLGESFAFNASVRPFRLVFETPTTFQFQP
ncbi:MAG: hypothetical protein AAFP90_21255 [Planctomycetota bacterium]